VTEALLQEIRTLKSVFESARDPEGRAFAPLVDAYRRAGEIQQAVRLLSEGLARHPDFVPGHVVAARLYVEQGLAEEAQIAARNALELDAENVSALRSLLRVLEEKGDAEAGEVRALLLALEPDFVPEEPAAPAPRRSRAAPPPVDLAPEPDVDSEAATVEMASLKTEEPPPALEATTAMEAIDLDSMGFDIGSLSRGVGGAYALDPEEATTGEDVMPTLVTGFGTTGEEPVIDLEGLAAVSEEVEEAVSLADLAPEPEPRVDLAVEEPVIDLEDLAPVGTEPDDEVVALADLAPEPEMELPTEEPVIDLEDLAPVEAESEEPVMDLADLAPEVEEPVMDLADLAPEAEEPVMDLADLAPEAEEPVMDLADLAPEAEEPVMDLEDLTPEAEEPVMDLADLAPEAEEPVIELEALAPEEPEVDVEPEPETETETPEAGEITMLDLAEMTAEEEVVIDLDALGPGPTSDESEAESEAEEEAEPVVEAEDASTPDSASEEEEGVGEPVYTRTLAELYVQQGAIDEALKVYRHLAELSPGDDHIARRIQELESGLLPEGSAHPEETEWLARDLAAGGDGEHDVESPFSWSGEEASESEEPGSSIEDYFDGLLGWKPDQRS
jgi:tetratricopeptide (TPR) repeat protein